MIGGSIALFLGLVLWILNLTGYGFRWSRDWPLIIVFFGMYELLSHIRRERRRKKVDVESILKELEDKKITVEEALKKIKKGGSK